MTLSIVESVINASEAQPVNATESDYAHHADDAAVVVLPTQQIDPEEPTAPPKADSKEVLAQAIAMENVEYLDNRKAMAASIGWPVGTLDKQREAARKKNREAEKIEERGDTSPLGQVTTACIQAGLEIPSDGFIFDGQYHRLFETWKGQTKNNGSYLLCRTPAGAVSGRFHNFRTDVSTTVRCTAKGASAKGISRIDTEELDAMEKRAIEAERQKHGLTKDIINQMTLPTLNAAKANNAYLTRKQVGVYGDLLEDEEGRLVLPVRDIETGEARSLQYIRSDGSKKFEDDSTATGCGFPIGEFNKADVILVAEGYATGASIHEATGKAVFCALSMGQLVRAARILKKVHPKSHIIPCADLMENGASEVKAKEAARKYGDSYCAPRFKDASIRKGDFNDLHVSEGLEAVKAIIMPAIQRITKSPYHCSFVVGDGTYKGNDDGVRFITDGEEPKTITVSGPMAVLGKTRTKEGNEDWGVHVEIKDDDGIAHRLSIPRESMYGDRSALCKTLGNKGLSIPVTQKAGDHLASFFVHHPTDQRVRCVPSYGWAKPGLFIAPWGNVGRDTDGEDYIFQNNAYMPVETNQSGTLEEWRDHVSHYAVGNSILLFGMSVMFASLIIPIVSKSSNDALFHIHGNSGDGKTTAQVGGASVHGHPTVGRFMCSWHTTTNALEGQARARSQLGMVLEELSQCKSKESGHAVYMLANRMGKARANEFGDTQKKRAHWYLYSLSSGEITLAQHVESLAGKKLNVGEEIRAIHIPSPKKKYRAMDNVYQFHNMHPNDTDAAGKAFVEEFTANAKKHYGTAGRAWLEYLANQDWEVVHQYHADLSEVFKGHKSLEGKTIGSSQARVMEHFIIVATAGELATKAGVTGWRPLDALEACVELYVDWLNGFGEGTREEHNILDHVNCFLQTYIRSKFEIVGGDGHVQSNDRIGLVRYHKDSSTPMELIIPAATFPKICGQYDPKMVRGTLFTHGYMESPDSKSVKNHHLGRTTKCYIIHWKGDPE